MTIRLLMVDDEIPEDGFEPSGAKVPYMWYYLKAIELEGEIDVTIARSYEEAKAIIEQPIFPFDVVCLDICMPFPGDGKWNRYAKLGDRTGLVILALLEQMGHDRPVILLSNIPKSMLDKDLDTYFGNIKVRVLEKIDTDPFYFVDHLKNVLKSVK